MTRQRKKFAARIDHRRLITDPCNLFMGIPILNRADLLADCLARQRRIHGV